MVYLYNIEYITLVFNNDWVLLMLGSLFIISAPSGGGKTTLVHHIVQRFAGEYPLDRVITYTTKVPRKHEVPGYDYHFVSVSEFERMIVEDQFLEWSNEYGAYYGSPRSVLCDLEKGLHRIIITDRIGAAAIRTLVPSATFIWLYTQNIQVLRERLEKRGQETDEQLCMRLQLAKKEIEEENVRPLYDFHVLNQNFFETLDHLSIIFSKKMKKK